MILYFKIILNCEKIFMKLLFVFILLMFASINVYAAQLTNSEKHQLTILNCHAKNYQIEQGRLLFGAINNKNKQKQLFLIKNITPYTIILDFPEGHIGATAWISQLLKANAWTGYLYIPGKDQLMTSHGLRRTKWTCRAYDKNFKALTDRFWKNCQNDLFVCRILYNPQALNPLSKQANQMIKNSHRSWWLNIDNLKLKTHH